MQLSMMCGSCFGRKRAPENSFPHFQRNIPSIVDNAADTLDLLLELPCEALSDLDFSQAFVKP